MHEASDDATAWVHKLDRFAKKRWQVVLVALAFAILLVVIVAYRFSAKDHQYACAFKISSQPLPETEGDAFRVDTCVKLEVVSTASERTLGLSGRESMLREQGMLFDFVTTGKYCMWMKDMNFPLDMLWLSADKRIVEIKEDVTPETYPQTFCGPESARYVVEVNSGVSKAGNLQLGQSLRF